jgi:tetratricopeptide (TPR) repeat protein
LPLTRSPKRISPNHTYWLTLDVDPRQGTLEGEERVRIHNALPQSVEKVVFTLDFNLAGTNKEMKIGTVRGESGAELKAINPTIDGQVNRSLLVVSWAKALETNSDGEMRLNFTGNFPGQVEGLPLHLDDAFYSSSSFYPRVIGHTEKDLTSTRHRDHHSALYRLQLRAPAEQVVASSGKATKEEVSGDSKTAFLESDGTRGCGLVMSPKFSVRSEAIQGVEVKSYSLPGEEERQARLLEAAREVLPFYTKFVGFYPWRNLSILPGSEIHTGGYASSNMVFIHKPEPKGSPNYINWIVAHEVAHQYWGAYVGESNAFPQWLTLGLGQWLDEKFERSKDKSLKRRPWKYYLVGVAMGVDTTIMQPLDKLDGARFDWNNIIAHSKSYSVIKMLEGLLGPYNFERAVGALLERYGGKMVTAKEFSRICEKVADKRLGWFFEEWLYADKKLEYKVTDQIEGESEGVNMLRIKVKRTGDAKMPVEIKAVFKDGSQLLDSIKEDTVEAEIAFTSKAKVDKIIIDPDEELPLKSRIAELEPDILGYALFNAGRYPEAAEKMREVIEADLTNSMAQFTLGLCLYDAMSYAEALGAFESASGLFDAGADRNWKAWSYIWIGHIHDVEGQRDRAIASYQRAIVLGSRERVMFDQYGIEADALSWANERLKVPFRRAK